MSRPTPSVIVITGGRVFVPSPDWADMLKRLYSEHMAITVFEGDTRGVDQFAGVIARREGIPVHAIPALWDHEGKRAGPVRNGRMLDWATMLGADLRRQVKLFAFPGGRGTADMTARCSARGVEIVEVRL